METAQTTEVTSQGEFIIKDKKETTSDSTKTTSNEGGIISNLWHKVLDTTGAAAHLAGLAAQTVRDTTSELTGELREEEAKKEKEGDSTLGQENIDTTPKDDTLIEHAKEIGSDAVEKLHNTLVSVGVQLHDFAGIVIEQSKSSDIRKSASQVLETLEHALEKSADVLPTESEEVNINAGTQLSGSGLLSFIDIVKTESQNSTPRMSPQNPDVSDTPRDLPSLEGELVLTMDVVSHIQRIADRTGDPILHETARKAHSACAKGLNEAPGVHLTWINPQQANDLVNLAIRTQDHGLADFARYCQSVAATTHVGVEPSPGKIQQEIQKGQQELQQQGRVHTGPGYGAAFASVNRVYNVPEGKSESVPTTPPPSAEGGPKPSSLKKLMQRSASQPNASKPQLELTMDVVSHIQRIADRTGNALLHETARKAHSAFAKGGSELSGVHLTWINPQQASELMNLASKTQDQELIAFARYCQSVAATTQVGVEPTPGKIQEEIMKGKLGLQLQQVQLNQQAQQSM